ncbi:MAG: DUF2156 domain-containing protein [Firmicutes bacterium]|nr:DUF2156 domain-containing protein [Bacillota bacterium]
MIFERDFNNLSEKDINLLNEYFDGCDYQSSSYTYIANYIWRNTHNITWQIIGEYLCIAGLGTLETEEGEYFMSFPLSKTGAYDLSSLRRTIEVAKDKFCKAGQELEIALIPGHLAPLLEEAFGERIRLTHDRADDDYIYLRSELVELKGRKYHQKKNHLNYFERNYEYTYEEIRPDTVKEVLEFLERINDERVQEMPEDWQHILMLETKAIEELLTFVGTGKLLTGVIRIGGVIEAVTIGEYARTNRHDSVLVHVEKAQGEIRGLYQAINHEFCRHLPEDVIFINREEDMGMENLRQAKLSYKPYMMGEKYSAVLLPEETC